MNTTTCHPASEPIDQAEATQPRHALRTECPTCEKLFRAVALAGRRWNVDLGGWTIVAAMNCDHCSCVVVAEFPCDAAGHVTGRPITARGVMRGIAREKFLIQHPELKGVAQV